MAVLAPVLIAASPPPTLQWTADACVRAALGHDPQLAEARARTRQWQARHDQIAALYRPKVNALGWAAPTYSVHGTGADRLVSYDFRQWGPYLRLQLTAFWPVYTFGAAESGLQAADARAAVEEIGRAHV